MLPAASNKHLSGSAGMVGMTISRVRLWAVALASVVSGCGDECSSYSSFSCKQIEAADYNVHFFYPSGNASEYLGQAKGLSECGHRARSFAANKNLSRADWGYICCMISRGSSCYEKHR
jgi:hypothetical protein